MKQNFFIASISQFLIKLNAFATIENHTTGVKVLFTLYFDEKQFP